MNTYRFAAPPGWPAPEPGWVPPSGWQPHPTWPPAPPGWEFWVPAPPAAESEHVTPEPPRASLVEPPSAPPRAESSAGPLHANPAPEPPRANLAEPSRTGPPKLTLAPPASVPAADAPEKAGRHRAPAPTEVSSAEQLDELRQRIEQAKRELVELDDAALLQQVGIYEYHHPLENAQQFKDELAAIRQEVKTFVKDGAAILASDRFAYNNSLAQGRRMTADFSKLMLRAYNAEADNCVRSVRVGTVASAKQRLDRSVDSIAKLGTMMEMRVAPEYHELRVREIELTGDYMFMLQEEREAARAERERLREEKRAEVELQSERDRLQKERDHYTNALAKLTEQGKQAEADELRDRLTAIDSAIEQNDYRIANIRAGYVYVISNIGAFGEDVVKIGMTRRLEPRDRILELGDASVPFPFDTHLLHFSEDAVALENELHKLFADRRVNHVNLRREFFFVTPQEIRATLTEKLGSILEFTESPEATQYFQSRSAWPPVTSNGQAPG